METYILEHWYQGVKHGFSAGRDESNFFGVHRMALTVIDDNANVVDRITGNIACIPVSYTHLIGGCPLIDKEEMARVKEQFKTYGQQENGHEEG